ncbi:MAG: hypothetical protein WDM76_10505 [Limisphaerales bacterium]
MAKFSGKGQAVKTFLIFGVTLTVAFSSFADSTNSLENFSPDFSTNTEILWQAPTNNLPKSFWIYKRLPPRPFLASVISNAVVLASLQDKGFPKPSTNDTCVLSSSDCNCSCSRICNFFIGPASTTITFYSPNLNGLTEYVPNAETVTKWAWECASQFGLRKPYLIPKSAYSKTNSDETATNQIYARGIFLSRSIDGISFMGNGNDGFDGEGFGIEFGGDGQIRSFSLTWPNLERDQNISTASPQQIIARIQARKIIVMPNADEETYFQRVKALANAKKFIITKITPYYGEGVFGEDPTNNAPPEFVTPFAELEAVADFGNSNATVSLFSPIISSDVSRLLGNKTK